MVEGAEDCITKIITLEPGNTLGIQYQIDEKLVIHSIKDVGLFPDWNLAHGRSQQVQAGDVIVEVNSHTDPQKMLEELLLPHSSVIKLQSARKQSNALVDRYAKGSNTVSCYSCFGIGQRTIVKPKRSETIRPAGFPCELYNDQYFGKLRKLHNIPEDFINVDRETWSYKDLSSAGGKGGCGCSDIGNHFFLKELSSGDHLSLCDIARTYVDHIINSEHTGTMINLIYLHYRDIATGRRFYVMKNHCRDPGPGARRALFDIKGCADDKTLEMKGSPIKVARKRCWHLHKWGGQCCWTPDRLTYWEGKQIARKLQISVLETERQNVLRIVQSDTDFLARHGLMDYSLLLACNRADAPDDGGAHTCGGVSDGEPVRLSLSIIDILQKWTLPKMIARAIKVLERSKATIPPAPYADQFERHFAELFVSKKF